jgi:hypothetical protein
MRIFVLLLPICPYRVKFVGKMWVAKESYGVLLSGVVPEQESQVEKASEAAAAAGCVEDAMSWPWHTATASR